MVHEGTASCCIYWTIRPKYFLCLYSFIYFYTPMYLYIYPFSYLFTQLYLMCLYASIYLVISYVFMCFTYCVFCIYPCISNFLAFSCQTSVYCDLQTSRARIQCIYHLQVRNSQRSESARHEAVSRPIYLLLYTPLAFSLHLVTLDVSPPAPSPPRSYVYSDFNYDVRTSDAISGTCKD